MASPRYLIGQGEKLSEDIARPPRGMGDKAHPYSFKEARKRLAPQFFEAAEALSELPESAQPAGQAALEITLHPSYLAKSYYPGNFMRELGLTHLGSRAVHIVPEKVIAARAEESGKAQPAPVLFVAGDIDGLIAFGKTAANWQPENGRVEDDFRRIESVAIPSKNRLKSSSDLYADRELVPMEAVLHDPFDQLDSAVVRTFHRFVSELGVRVDAGRTRQVSGLVFVPVMVPRDRMQDMLQFTFLRVLREAPRIVPFDPIARSAGNSYPVNLTMEEAVAPDLAVAIFDGGLPDNHGLGQWVSLHDAPGVGPPVPAGQKHGLAVTSAFLFGPLEQGKPILQPLANVDHWRIYGDSDVSGDFEAIDMLDRIEEVLSSRRYDFINISLGPDYAIDDDDISPWTARLDELLASGETVATIACGNNGELDQAANLHRIQPPSDGVNVLGVGACGTIGTGASRASYSAWGPGRSPGFVKPDFVTFGGSHGTPFLALTEVSPHAAAGTRGTSFASPLAMRSGAGVRAHFADPLWAPAIKALLVHHAYGDETLRPEIGWGLVSHGLGDLILCDDGEAHIVYQRTMPTTGAVRLYLPVPDDLSGMVEIKATFSFYCEVDPEDSINYTRGGLDIQFRPDTTKIPPPYLTKGKLITPTVPASDSFFSAKHFYPTEHMLRDDAQKWETTLSRKKNKRASSLNQPAFDVSFVARENGQNGRRPANMKFALALTLRNKGAPDLYDRVIVSSRNRLQPLRPRAGVSLPVRLGR